VTPERRRRAARNRDGAVPPGPRGLPVVGPLLDLRRDVLATMHGAMLRFGDVVRFAGRLPGRLGVGIYALYHPDDVQHMRTAGDDVYSKQDASSVELRGTLGDGLLTSVGEVWRRQRRIVEPLFRREQVAAYFPIMSNEAQRLVAAWRVAAERGQTVDLHRDSTGVSRRVMARVLFSDDAEQMLALVAEHLPYLSQRVFKRSVAPLRIPATWPTPHNRRAARARQALFDGVDDVIARRRGRPTADLVSLLIQASDPEGGPGLNDREVRDQVMVFVLAGSDQPATHIAFVLHFLGHHPDAQREAREEIDAVLDGRHLTVADVEALSRTAAAIKEAMRLHPSAYALSRYVEKDQNYRGYRIPAGVQAVCVPWVTHRHPAFWDDPERFDLDRFRPEAESDRHPFAYMAFGGGPHGCVGRRLAMMEMVVVTANLLQSFQIVTEGRRISVATGINLRPAAPMPAEVVAR
jgi:cytochrome P450